MSGYTNICFTISDFGGEDKSATLNMLADLSYTPSTVTIGHLTAKLTAKAIIDY